MNRECNACSARDRQDGLKAHLWSALAFPDWFPNRKAM